MVQAVDCPPGAAGPIGRTPSARVTPCGSTKCRQCTCRSTVFPSSGAARAAGEPCCSAAARRLCHGLSQSWPSVSRQKNLYSRAAD